MLGVELIAAERKRQIEKEGWDASHDDKHTDQQIAYAAVCYALPVVSRPRHVLRFWPWDWKFWKPWEGGRQPEGRIRELVKAGALIAAEIDRLQRSVSAT